MRERRTWSGLGAISISVLGIGLLCERTSAQLKELQITFEDYDHMNPVWGPDLPPVCDERGDFICYEIIAPNGHRHLELRQFNIGGGVSAPVSITDPAEASENFEPCFSPSGDSLVHFKRTEGLPAQIFRVQLPSRPPTTSDETLLLSDGAERRSLRMSPDGTLLIYEKRPVGSSTWQVWTFCLACGEEALRAAEAGQDCLQPTWSPDSDAFVFLKTIAGPDSPRNLIRFRFNPPQGQPPEVPLTQDAGPADYAEPFWTIDDLDYGRYVIAARRDGAKLPYQTVEVWDDGSLFVRPLTGLGEDGGCAGGDESDDHRMAQGGPQNSRKIILSVTGGKNGQTWLVRLLNNYRADPPGCPDVLRVTSDGIANPRWDPNNTNAIYQRSIGNRWQLFILDSVF